MYVAITRARRRLYLTHAQSRMLHGQVRYNIASRFLDEIAARARRSGSRRAGSARRGRRRSGRMGRRAARGAVGRARSAATRDRSATTRGPAWRIGQSVRHAKFGVGVIIDAEGRGATRACRSTSATRVQVAGARVREARGGLNRS